MSCSALSCRPDTPQLCNTLYADAAEAAAKLRLSCGIVSSNPDEIWTTHQSLQLFIAASPSLGVFAEAQVQFVQAMKAAWRPLGTDRIEIPGEWISDSHLLKLGGDMKATMLQAATFPIRDALTSLSPKDCMSRSTQLVHTGPDFTYPPLPQKRRRVHMHDKDEPRQSPPDITTSASCVLDIVAQLGDTSAAHLDLCVACAFTGMPGFIVRRNPVFCFYPCFGPCDDLSVEYALVRLPIAPTRSLTRKKAQILPVGLLNSAVLLHISEVDSEEPSPSADPSASSTLTSADLMRLARNAQPHLDALLMAFSLRHSQGVSTADIPTPASPREPPPWAILFGIFQKRGTLHIVAHLPSWDASNKECHYHAVLVDSLPFAPPTSPADQTLARLRIAIALLTLKKHCVRLSAVWEDRIVWPEAIVDCERILADEITGIVSPMPSVKTYTSGWSYLSFDGLDENEPFDTGADEEDIERSRAIVAKWLKGEAIHE